jgi:hypothetical protein
MTRDNPKNRILRKAYSIGGTTCTTTQRREPLRRLGLVNGENGTIKIDGGALRSALGIRRLSYGFSLSSKG